MLPSGRIGEYREPMLGGGSVYFHARERNLASTYWLNDLFTELVSFYSCVRDEELCKRLVMDLTELRESLASPEQAREFFLAARPPGSMAGTAACTVSIMRSLPPGCQEAIIVF